MISLSLLVKQACYQLFFNIPSLILPNLPPEYFVDLTLSSNFEAAYVLMAIGRLLFITVHTAQMHTECYSSPQYAKVPRMALY